MRPKAPPVVGERWLNSAPIGPEITRRRVTLLVFWAAGCEASLVHLTRLGRLSAAEGLADPAIIAVHSPRFAYERNIEVVEQAIDRARIELPVVHDPRLETWSRYSPRGWPSTIVIDDRGRVAGASSGLDEPGLLPDVVDLCNVLAEPRRRKTDDELIPLPPASPVDRRLAPPDQLRWPSGLSLLTDGRLAVADAGNDRVLIFELGPDHRIARFDQQFAGLDRPHDVCQLDESTIAVSEPLAGRVRGIDLATGSGPPLVEGLVRPLGLTLDRDRSLVITDAGAERIVRLASDGNRGVIAGSGYSGTADGPADRCELAQPVAATRTPVGLAFLDAASSALRLLTDEGRVLTTTPATVNEPGLVDGPAHQARLQRPSGIAWRADGSLVIADTGNNRLRVLSERRIRTLGLAGLSRPEAVAELPDGKLVVADTGNHRLIVVDGDAEMAWPLELIGLLPDET